MQAWFHCGHCASLFKAFAGTEKEQHCPSCGKEPSLGMEAEEKADAVSGPRDPMLRVKMAEVEKPLFHKREVRKHKGRFFALKLILVWVMVLVVVGGLVKYFTNEAPREYSNLIEERATRGTYADADIALLDKAYRPCLVSLSGFLSAGTPEVRNQYVKDPVNTAGKMARYYQTNPLLSFEVSKVRGTGSGIIHLKDGRKLVETRWTIEDGREFDSVFFYENGEWRLDWEEFVRYGDHPWVLFMNEKGDGEGEFRLFARRRVEDERNVQRDEVKVILHAPRFGFPAEVSDPSPEISIDGRSEKGKMLLAAFKERDEGGRVYGSSLENPDPEGMIRVRVRVKRSDTSLGKSFTIDELKACHWLAIDDPGVEAR